VRVEFEVTPRASRARIDGPADEADGSKVLKVAVTAPPEDGKANRAVIELMAKEWKLPKSAFEIASGATGKRKSVAITGDSMALLDRLNAWLRKRNE
jgi:uncharacterized protein (TIGR00251 family)